MAISEVPSAVAALQFCPAEAFDPVAFAQGRPVMKFTKMQGAGNDYIYLDARGMDEDWPSLSRAMSDRHFGIGAELMYKKLDYFEQSEDVGRGDLVTDLDPNLNGDTLGFMLTLTIQ